MKNFALLSAFALSLGAFAQAQTRHHPPIIDPPIFWPRPPLPPALGQELRLLDEKAKVQINGAVAKTSLVQTFQNPTDRQIEGTYLFPVPRGAAVSGFAMTVNGKRTEAEILPQEKAREIYDGIVRKLRDPGILEFSDRDVLKARIFPIAPRAKIEVELGYSQNLKTEGQNFRYDLPFKLPLGGAAQSASLEMELSAPDLKAIYSPTHEIAIKRDGDKAKISGEWSNSGVQTVSTSAKNGGADRDFSLVFTTAKGRVGVNVLTYRTGKDDPYFMLLAAPDGQISDKEIAAKDVVFVFDTSGSMGGEKIEQAKRALDTILGNLNPNDRFNIVTFASDVNPFRDNLVAASQSNLSEARDFARGIKAVGGTNINDALQSALTQLKLAPVNGMARPQQIVFMTDGQPTVGETRIETILENAEKANPDKNGARIFTFGVGYDVNTRLLDTLAEENRGSSDYVTPNEDIEAKVGSLYAKIAYPVLTSAKLNWGGAQVYDVYPPVLPDLFRGTQAVVFGRIRGDAKPSVQLVGMAGGQTEKIGGEVAQNGASEEVPRLWAMRKVGYLIDDARRNGRAVPDEVKDEIIALSKKFGIVTPLTAGLITEDGTPIPAWRPRPVPGPMDSGAFGGVGGAADMPSSVFRDRNGALAAPAPESGQRAVAASRATNELRETQRADKDENARYVEGKAFFLRDGVWTDTLFDAKKSPKIETVKFASPEYFELAKDPKIAKWLSLGDRVLLVLEGKTIKIEP